MSELNINIKIAGRVYPLQIDSSEEEIIRYTVKKLEEDLRHLEDAYVVRDKQDLLAMAIVKYGVELNDIKKEMDAKIGNKVQEINQRLETHIAETAKNETNSNTDSI